MSDRMQLLEDAYQAITKYTNYHNVDKEWRPGITDLMTYDIIIGMHESDYDDSTPMWLWRKTPNEVMQHIIESSYVFSLEYGLDQMDEEIRDYLIDNNFIVDVDDIEEE